MNLNPKTTTLTRDGGHLMLSVEDQSHLVDRVARAFPQTDPDHYIGFLDVEGHEIGILEHLDGLDADSRTLLEAELKIHYFVPTIQTIDSVESRGTGSVWKVSTDDGAYTFRILGRDALNGSKPPAIEISDETGRKYRIQNYWELDAESRDAMSDLIPDEILKARYMRRGVGSGMRMR